MNTLRYKIKKSSKDIKSKTNSKQKNNDQNWLIYKLEDTIDFW